MSTSFLNIKKTGTRQSIYRVIPLFFFLFFLRTDVLVGQSEQRFGFLVFSGLNLSQIDGDNSYGYNKLGLQAGIKTRYALKEKWETQIGIHYSSQGAQSTFLSSSPFQMKIDLHYLVVPLELHFRDWMQVSGYHKIHFLTGIHYGRLFQYTVNDGGFGVAPDNYAANDISWTVGTQYLFTKSLGIGLRYNRSFNLLYNRDRVQGSVYRSMLGYFVNLQIFYQL
jgi:hypothetical protein